MAEEALEVEAKGVAMEVAVKEVVVTVAAMEVEAERSAAMAGTTG